MEALEKRLKAVENTVKMAGLAAKEVLTFEEAARFTGLSKSYLYKQTAAQKVPHYKPAGKMCYFNRLELQAWLQRNRIATTDEIEQEAANYVVSGKRKGGRK
jgi:excisionase family DNA binding protein